MDIDIDMDIDKAYSILDADRYTSEDLLKANFKWLVCFYHPDIRGTEYNYHLSQIIEAYNTIKNYRGIE